MKTLRKYSLAGTSYIACAHCVADFRHRAAKTEADDQPEFYPVASSNPCDWCETEDAYNY